MEAMGVFSSCVTALIKLSCCSLRLISRTRKMVFSTSPAMIRRKKIAPRKRRTPSRQFRMIQPTLSATARAIRQMPSVSENAMALRRLVMRMKEFYSESPLQQPVAPAGATVLKALRDQLLDSQRALAALAFHHLLDILCDQIGFKVHRVSGLQGVQVRHLDGMRNNGDGAAPAFNLGHRQADALDRNRPFVHGVFFRRRRATRCGATSFRNRQSFRNRSAFQL